MKLTMIKQQVSDSGESDGSNGMPLALSRDLKQDVRLLCHFLEMSKNSGSHLLKGANIVPVPKAPLKHRPSGKEH